MPKKAFTTAQAEITARLGKTATIATGVFLVFWAAGLGLILWRVMPSAYGREIVPLHYNVHVGIDTFGPWWMLFMVPVMGLAFACLNAIAARIFARRAPALSIAFWITTAAIAPFLFLACASIVLLNIAYG